MTTKPIFPCLAVIGAGSIGSSIARAARRVCTRIVLCDKSRAVRNFLKAADFEVTASARNAVREADCVVIAVPMGDYETLVAEIATALRQGAVVTDVGSVKGSVCALFARALPSHVFAVPAHPIAGTERSGPRAGNALMFRDRYTVLTPFSSSPSLSAHRAVKRLERFWKALGSRVIQMDAQQHDALLALTSHLPHVVAYALVLTALDSYDKTLLARVSAGGFRDFTRIAASSSRMWRDIFLDNHVEVLKAIRDLRTSLDRFEHAIAHKDGEQLQALFDRARAFRSQVLVEGQAGLFLPHDPQEQKPGE